MWSSPGRSGKLRPRGDIAFGVSSPLLNPIRPYSPHRREAGQHLVGQQWGWQPHIPDLRTTSGPALGQRVPAPPPAYWPVQSSSAWGTGEGVHEGGQVSPTAATTAQRDTSHALATHGRL